MHPERGFVLLEVLIAAAVAAIGLAVLLHTALDGMVMVRAAGTYETAIVLARSHLALLGRDVSGFPPTSEGKDGPFAWHLHVVRERISGPGLGVVDLARHQGEDQAALFDIALDITWSSGGIDRVVHVETRRLGFVPPPSDRP